MKIGEKIDVRKAKLHGPYLSWMTSPNASYSIFVMKQLEFITLPTTTLQRVKFPYQNYSLENLPGEKWKDIPDFEGLYKISNHGRVKSLPQERQMNTPAGGVYLSKELIRKSRLDMMFNKTIQQNLYTLVISLYRDGSVYSYSVARLVYYIFVEEFDLSDRLILISYKDHDGRNTHVSNLIKSDISSIKLTSYKKGRALSHLTILSKQITQFNLDGEPAAVFPSIYDAARKTGFSARNISEAVNGKVHLYRGFFWKQGHHIKKLNLKKIARNVEREEIHSTLRKRLRIRGLDPKKIPPFLNLSTKSARGEQWKDVPGYEGLYQASNQGRIKALSKVTNGKQQKWMPEQIQKIAVDFRTNSEGKEIPGSCFACMAKDGRKKAVSVPRLVYFLFVQKFDLTDTSWRIYYKDGNSLNIRAENLMLKRGVWSFAKVRDTA